jgi:hypothetical protein
MSEYMQEKSLKPRDGQINAITPKKRISEEFMEYIGNKV